MKLSIFLSACRGIGILNVVVDIKHKDTAITEKTSTPTSIHLRSPLNTKSFRIPQDETYYYVHNICWVVFLCKRE